MINTKQLYRECYNADTYTTMRSIDSYLKSNILQFTVHFVKFHNLPEEEITITMRDFSISNMNHSIIDIEIQLRRKN